jgi:DNA-binding SARP family transcriptional activator
MSSVGLLSDSRSSMVDRRNGHNRGLDVLGPTRVQLDGVVVPLRPRELDLLAALALCAPHAVPMELLESLLWLDPPPTASKALHNHVARVRRALGPDAVITGGGAYRLGPGWELDTDRFLARLGRARRSALIRDYTVGRASLQAALADVRGEPFADLPESARVTAERARWWQLVMAAREEHVLVLLAAGDIASGVAISSSLVEVEPFREVRWMALAIGLYRSGQRRESLRVLNSARAALRDAAGLSVGPALARLEALILEDNPLVIRGDPFALVDHRPSTSDVPFDIDEFVGRKVLLADCERVLTEALDSQSARSIEVTADEGMGKTAFATRLASGAILLGWDVVWGTCWPTPSRTLEPLGDIVRHVLEHQAHPENAFDPSLLADASLLWRQAGDDTPRGHLGEAAVEIICQHAERAPTMIVIDDAQHLSASAQLVVDRLCQSAVPLVLVLLRATLATPRSGDALFAASTIVLPGLDTVETGQLLGVLSRASIAPEVALAASVASGGNPMLLRQMALSYDFSVDAQSAAVTVTVAELWGTVRDKMTPAVRRIAELLAVAGSAVTTDVIGGAVGMTDDELLADVIVSGVTTTAFRRDAAGRVDLASDGLRTVMLRNIPTGDRLDLHQALASALTGTGASPLAIAPHRVATAKRDPLGAVDAATRAGELAFEATMYAEGATWFAHAAFAAADAFSTNDPQVWALGLREVECLRLAGDPRSHELAERIAVAAETAGDHDTFATAACELCRLGPATRAGAVDPPIAALVERAIVGCTDERLRARTSAQASLMYSLSGSVERCRSHFMDALVIARRCADDLVLAEVLSNAYSALTDPSDWALGRQLANELLRLGERLSNDHYIVEALHLMFAAQIEHGDPLLRTVFARQVAVAASLRGATHRWQVGYQSACLAFIEGRFDDALAISQRTYDDSPADPTRALGTHLQQIFFVRLAQGQGQQLAADIDDVIVAQPGIPGWRAAAAWLAALRGDTERVRSETAILCQGHGLPGDSAWSGAAMLLGRAIAATGDTEAASVIEALLAPYTGMMTWLATTTLGPFDVALGELALVRRDHAAAARYLASGRRCVARLGAVAFSADLDALGTKIDASLALTGPM